MDDAGNETIVVRLSWPWRLIAPAFVVLAAAYPLLVRYVELRPLERSDVLPAVGVLVLGLAYWWYVSHSVRIEQGTFTFKSPWRLHEIGPQDIAAVGTSRSWVTAIDRSGRKYRVSAYAAGSEDLAVRLRAAARNRYGGS